MLTHKEIAALSDSELVRRFEAQVGFICSLDHFEGATCHCGECSEIRMEITWLRNALDARLAANKRPLTKLQRHARYCSGCERCERLESRG